MVIHYNRPITKLKDILLCLQRCQLPLPYILIFEHILLTIRTGNHISNRSIMTKVGVNHGNDLIVNFGHRRSPTNADKQVSFSEDIIVHCFQYPSREEVSVRWNSKRDKYFFNQELARDVRSLRCLLSITPMEDIEKEALYGCVGLEALVSSKVARFLNEKKQYHARSIVEMQYCLSEEQLAAYAVSHSSQSRERAQKLAAGYSKILP